MIPSSRPGPVWPWLAAVLGLAGVLAAPGLLDDPDTWWHVAAGRWMLRHGRIPLTDPFSWTMLGQPWQAHEWGAELLMAGADRVAGWAGVAALTAASAALALGLLCAALGRVLPAGPALLLAALAVAGVAPELLARPHLLALPALVAWTAGLVRARAADRAPSAWLLPVMLVWANLHGGFMVGLVLCAGLAAEAALARSRALGGWVAFGVAAIGAAALNPQGWRGLLFPFALLRLHGLARITEWRPIRLDRLEPVELMAAAVLYLVVARGVRIPPVRAAMLAALAWTACAHSRNQMLAGVVGALLLADPLARVWPRGAGTPRFVTPRFVTPGLVTSGRWVAAGSVAAMAALGVTRLAVPVVRGDGVDAPVSAVAAVGPALRSRPVFNSYDFGGFLIFAGIRPFVDGRADLYGDRFLRADAAARDPATGTLARLLDTAPIAWTILKPAEPDVAVMDRRAGWHRVYADRFAVVHARDADR